MLETLLHKCIFYMVNANTSAFIGNNCKCHIPVLKIVNNQELMNCKVNNSNYQLTPEELDHFKSSYVNLIRLEEEPRDRITVWGLRIRPNEFVKFDKGNKFLDNTNQEYDEIIIDGKVVRICLVPNCLNLKITSPESLTTVHKRRRMFNNGQLNKSILKQNLENGCNTSKSVSFNNTFYITPISPRQPEIGTPVKDYESKYKEYLKSVQMNGACSTPEQGSTSDKDMEEMVVEALDEEPPKRKRGRPKGSGKLKHMIIPKKRKGWPIGVPRKPYDDDDYFKKPATPVSATGSPVVKRGRGRPRKIVAFGFQTIVSDIKTVSLPSDLWSAHVSVTAKKSQVCFTRVVQAVSSTVPVECDRSVKFNGSVDYLVRINNRDVELLAAPPSVMSIRDVEILLEIINEIDINDPVLEYLDR